MTQRKGQWLFNKIAEKHTLLDHKCTMNKDRLDLFPYYNLHQVLFYMSDETFDEIMQGLHSFQKVEDE